MSTLRSDQIVLERPSTKVSNPPGGKSSIFFGDAPAEPAQQNRRGAASAPAAQPQPAAAPAAAPAQQQQQQQPTEMSAKQRAQQQMQQSDEPQKRAVHTSVHVSNPPGGKSSIFFG